MEELKITSSAFKHGEAIPSKYSCDGEEVNPPINVEHIPKRTESLALIVEDPDAPSGNFVHWVVWNISPDVAIEENMIPGDIGVNSAGENSYKGPCPPSGTHRYFFRVYALDTVLDIEATTDKEHLMNEIEDNILAEGELMGIYGKGD